MTIRSLLSSVSLALLIGSAALLGTGIAVAGPLLSGFIKRHFRDQVGKVVGWYSFSMAIGGAGGMMQAASRTMMVRHTTPDRATEGFGLYALSGKATAFLAPFSIAAVTQLTGSQRMGISPLIVMFLLSLALLSWVEPEGEPDQ